jgi:protein-ribulosamine 3-kinase
MKTLIAKFPEGYEGWARERGEEPVERVIPPTSMVSGTDNCRFDT